MGRFVPKQNLISHSECSVESLDLQIAELSQDLAAINDNYLINSNESFDLAISMESIADRTKAAIQRIKTWIMNFIKWVTEAFKKITGLASSKAARAKAKAKAAKESVAKADSDTVNNASKEAASDGVKVNTRFAGDIK